MQEWFPPTISAAVGLIVGYLLGYMNHGLAIRREEDSRRRGFRDKIRSISLRFDDVRWINLFKTYNESVAEVKDACAKVSEDIKFWRRRGFTKYRDNYCSFKESDFELPRPNTAAGMEEYLVANKKKHQEAKSLLQDSLERITTYAR